MLIFYLHIYMAFTGRALVRLNNTKLQRMGVIDSHHRWAIMYLVRTTR